MPGNSAFTLDTMVRFIADEQSIAAVNRSISTIKNFARTALGAIGVGFSLRELNRMTESYRSMKNEMAAVFGSTEDLAAIQEKIKKTARDVSGEYERIADNVTTLVKNNKRVFDVDTATRFTDVMWKLTKMSGGDNASASAAVQSLSSAMKNGKIDRGAIDQLINNVPQAVKVLTSYYGVTQERLRSMAQAGLIRSAQVRDAFLRAGEDIDKAFGDVQMNITDVLSSFKSEFAAFIGETDEMLGITKTLSKILKDGLDFLMKGLQKARSGLIWLSDKLGGMENVLKLLAILAGSFFIAFHLKDIITGLTNILGIFTKLGLKGMALVAVIALIALMIDDLVHFIKGDKKTFLGDLLDFKGINPEEAKDRILGTFRDIGEKIGKIWEEIQIPIKNFILVFRAFCRGIKRWWEQSGADEVKEALKKFKDAFIDGWDALKQWMDENMPGIIKWAEEFGQTFGEAFGAALNVVADIFSLLVHLLTGDQEKAKKDLEELGDDLGRLITKLLDLIFGRGFTENAKQWGKDFAEEWKKGFIEGWVDTNNALFDAGQALGKLFNGLFTGDTEGMKEGAVALFNAFKDFIVGLLEIIFGKVLVDAAFDWGKKMIQNFFEGIKQAWSDIGNYQLGWMPKKWREALGLGGEDNFFDKLKGLRIQKVDTQEEKTAEEMFSDLVDNFSKAIGQGAVDAYAGLTNQSPTTSYKIAGKPGTYTQNTTLNFYETFNGDAATTHVRDNVEKANSDSVDKITRAIEFAY